MSLVFITEEERARGSFNKDRAVLTNGIAGGTQSEGVVRPDFTWQNVLRGNSVGMVVVNRL